MKKRIAFIGAILSLIPFGQPLIIKTSVVLSSSAVMLFFPEKAQAESASFYFDRAFSKGKKGDYYGAISDFTKVIELNPKDAVAYYNRGWNKGKLKDYYGAISDYNKSISINPKEGQSFFYRSIFKEKINDLKGACADSRKALSLGYKNVGNQKWIKKNC